MSQSAQWINGTNAEATSERPIRRLSTLEFLLRYPVFLLAFGPPVFRQRSTFDGVDTSQSHFDFWSIIQVGWLFAIALRAVYRLGSAERFILPLPVRSVLKYSAFLGLVFTVSIAYSPGRAISAEFSILYFLTLICVVEFLVDARQHPPDWLQVIFVLRRIMLVLLGLVLLCLFISPAMVMNLVEDVGVRLGGGPVAPLGAAGPMIAIISAFSFIYALERRSRSVICFLIGVAVTLVTQARGAEITLFLCLAILGLRWAKTGKRVAYFVVAGSTVVVMLACLAAAIIGPDRIWDKFNRGQETADILTLSGRTEVWADVIDSSLSHPQGMGYIAGVRKFRGGRYKMNLHANLNGVGGSDNSYFDVLSGGGWLALGCYLMFIAKTVVLGLRSAAKPLVRPSPREVASRHALRCALLLLLFCLVTAMEGADYVVPLRHVFYIQNIVIAVILGISTNLRLASRPRYALFHG